MLAVFVIFVIFDTTEAKYLDDYVQEVGGIQLVYQ